MKGSDVGADEKRLNHERDTERQDETATHPRDLMTVL
jgi:hypothetical protein